MKKIMLGILSISSVLFIGCSEKEYNAFSEQPSTVSQMMKNEKVVGWIDYEKDTDKDKIPDYLDKCPNTKLGVKVDKNGCMIDSDKDGVEDDLDKCPNTPKGMKVNFEGCPILKVFKFDFKKNSYEIDKKYYPEIEKIANILKNNKNLKIEIETLSKNNKKSLKKLEVLKNILVNKFKIDAKRINIAGYEKNSSKTEDSKNIFLIDKSNYKKCKDINCIVK